MAIKYDNRQRINIDEDFYIEVDELNWTLHCIKETDKSKRKTVNDTRDVIIGYYANLRNTIRAYIEYKQLGLEQANSLQEYCNIIDKNNNETVKKIERLLK